MNPNKDHLKALYPRTQRNASNQAPGSWVLWSVLIVPWVLDVLCRTAVLTTLLGASCWGMALLVALLRPRTRDQRLRRLLSQALIFLSLGWALHWSWALWAKPINHAWLRPLPVTLLIKVHAALLAAGLGMVLVLCLGSAAYLLQDRLIRADSWERRRLPFRLPSLESLGRLSSSALSFSLMSWGIGLALATLTALVSQRSGGEKWLWLSDPQVLVTAFLWALLLALHRVRSQLWGERPRALHGIYFLVSGLFVLSFALHWALKSSGLHRPLQWFVQ